MMSLLCRQKKKEKIKKKDSLQTHKSSFTPMNENNMVSKEKTSLFASEKGSMTVESAVVLPFFLFFIVSFLLLIKVISLQVAVTMSLSQISKELARDAYVYKKIEIEDNTAHEVLSKVILTGLSDSYVKDKLVSSLGKEYLDQSFIKGKSNGLSLYQSRYLEENDMIDLIVCYKITLPFPSFKIPDIPIALRARTRGWTGWSYGEQNTETKEYVYITETGTVYHRELNCTHLDLSIQGVNRKRIEELRNTAMGKYYECEICEEYETMADVVYITDTGNRFHNTLDCSGLKRGIKKILKSEAGGRRPCSRCGD